MSDVVTFGSATDDELNDNVYCRHNMLRRIEFGGNPQ